MVCGGGEGVAVESGLWLESLSDWTSRITVSDGKQRPQAGTS